MLREAELFVMAEQMLVEVLGRIGPRDEDIELPPLYAGALQPMSLRAAVSRQVSQDALLSQALTGTGRAEDPAPVPGSVVEAAATACSAAGGVQDGDRIVASPGGPLAARELLLRSAVARSLLAHYVAAYLGSTACPLPEELARPLWELTWPQAPRWRALGYFRDPMALPEHVSWRDRFLLCAGHEPHPLGH